MQARALETGDYMLTRFGGDGRPPSAYRRCAGKGGSFPASNWCATVRTLEPATEEAGRIVNHLRQQGVLASTDGPLDNVLKFKPPMVFGKAEADILIAALEVAFADIG